MKRTSKKTRLLLIEANNMSKWIGGRIPYGVHIPPIALLYLASYVRENNPDLEIRVLDLSLHAMNEHCLRNLLRDFDPDLIGVRSIIFFREELEWIAKLCRATSDASIVVGGPIVHALGSKLLSEIPEIEMAVRGEGELALSMIVNGEPAGKIPGLIYRDGNGIASNDGVREIEDIDSLPFPAYDLINLQSYCNQLSYSYNFRRQGVLYTSRGCNYNCTFCFNHWKKTRIRSADNVISEIQFLYDEYGIRDFFVIDDMFNVDRARAMTIFERIISLDLKLRLYFANGLRADRVDEQFIDMAIRAGAIWFTYAVETANEEMQKLIRKRIDLEKARSVIAYTQNSGVAVNVSTMYGFPFETPRQAQETIDWLLSLPKPSLLPYHFCLRIFPGCEIEKQAVDAGWDPALISLTSEYSYNDLPFGTPTFPKDEMMQIFIRYHNELGLNNKSAISEAIRTLRAIEYSDREILAMYSVLKRRELTSIAELL